MFERMEITESIHEVVVETSYNKTTWADSNRAGHSRKNIEEAASSWTLPKKGDISGKHRKRYVDSPTGKSKTCLIHGPGHYLEECKVLVDFGTKYANSRPTKDRGISPVTRKKINRQQGKNAIVTNQWVKFS